MTTERPILFSGPMVRALLDGRKTQTRRLVKLRDFGPSTTVGYDWAFRDRRALWNEVSLSRLLETCPYGQLFDRLWVRETWHCNHVGKDQSKVNYRADGRTGLLWTPSIHMPRWASRITMEVTDVSVERLQSISMADVAAEGFQACEQFEGSFSQTWDALNGKRATWASNPWVWAVSFRVLP